MHANTALSTRWPVVLAALLVMMAAALAGCSPSASSGSSAYGTGDSKLAASNLGSGPTSPFLADGQAVLRGFDAIAAKSGKPLRVTSLTSDRMNGLQVDVQEPKNHVNVDRYVIAPDGTMTGPTPVKLSMIGGNGPVTAKDVDARAFDPKTIAFARLTQTAREAIAKSNMTDARVSEWEISGIGPDDRKYMYLDAARGRPVAAINNQLGIVRMTF